jgi:hypothetical protein
MNSKRLLQIFVLFVLLFSPVGSVQQVRATTDESLTPLDPVIINRSLSYWDAIYVGYVNGSLYEKWQFVFTETHSFTVTVTTIAGDLVPLLILQDANDGQLASGVNTLTSTQPAGTYYIQVQPESGGGFYILTLREVAQSSDPSVSTQVNPTSVNVGETSLVTVNLNNVPAEGYTSAEFTCTYNPSLVEVSNIAVTNLFGADPAVAINGPQGGSFIVAIAGSGGNRATTSGAAFTFTVTGLQAGQTTIECTARVSKGDNVLTSLPSTGTSLTVTGSAPPTPTFTSTPPDGASPTPTSTSIPTDEVTPTPTDEVTPTPTFTPTDEVSPTPTFTPTEEVTPTPTFTTTPEVSPTPTSSPTSTPLPDGTITGTVLAGKPVAVGLYDAGNSLVASVNANPDGTFSLTAPAGTYTIIAVASGYLSAQGIVTLTDGGTVSMPIISLLAGDIDNNNVIDQLDAMTIGMNYNAATPAAADLNNDGIINVLDLELLAANYRETGPIAWQ